MFFSTDPRDFSYPKACTLDNSTIVYLNSSRALHCSCAAPFHADPDFAGPGIITSFLFISWLTILIAAIPTYYAVKDSWSKSRNPYRFLKFAADLLQLRVASTSNTPLTPKSAKSLSSDAEPRLTGGPASDTLPISFPSKEPSASITAKQLLVSLCDIQITTGIAMVVTGLVQFPRISFYHEQFAVNFWWLTLNSFWVSRIDYTTPSAETNGWRFQARRIAIVTSVLLSVVFQALIAVREHNSWNSLKSGRCYVSTGAGGDDYGQNLFWLAGTALYAIVLILSLTSRTRTWLEANVMSRLEPSLIIMWGWATGSFDELKDYHHDEKARSAQTTIGQAYRITFLTIKTISYGLAWFTWWFLVQFLAIWSSGNGPFVVELVVYSIFAGFSTWWIVFLKVENRALVIGSESKWTFGQCLPLALLLLVMLNVLDIVKKTQ
ncbi:hypothetical protein AOQ84DRAFT_351369 [Glonium stellatum]|uniref:Uncharacterized protein n=1 Tax=Glonium stellatum TaxID=574774 RepID=A0A8E2FCM7_9PEZI|nr:hypothetical protein AOQ84DRAFT_351369 [Glonium stellatum]